MKNKILINGTTISGSAILPILLRAKYWQSRGFRVEILGSQNLKREIVSYKRIKNFGFIELKGCSSSIKTKYGYIFEVLKRNLIALSKINKIKGQYDIIHSISSMLDFLIFPYFLKFFDKNIKWVTVFDNVVPLSDPGNKLLRLLAWLFFQLSLVLLKRADIIFVISTDLRGFLIKKGFQEDRIVISGNGLDVELMRKARVDKNFNIDALFVGRINETKGIFDMLKALEIILRKYPNFQFAVMGRGDEETESRFKKQIKEKRLERNVQFFGYRMGLEKFNIIKTSKCFWFLSVSDSESFGIALLEAVCLGLPALVYDLIPFRKIYKNSEVFIFKKHDYRSVAQKTLQIFDKKQFNQGNRKDLMNYYSWDRIAKIEVDVFCQFSNVKN